MCLKFVMDLIELNNGYASFFVVGVSYKTANIDLRGKFSLNDTQHHAYF